MSRLSIIVPALDEAAGIEACLRPLQGLRARGVEVIVVDGGSGDATRELAMPLADRVLDSTRGRARQMNAGAVVASGDALLFLHADTLLPADADGLVHAAIAAGARWGRFDVSITGSNALLRAVAFTMNARSRYTGIATGDQAIFVKRAAFDEAGGFPDIPLMEDVALSRALRGGGRPACLRAKAITSGRRWEKRGTLRTILLMWRLRLAYASGADPRALAHRYDA